MNATAWPKTTQGKSRFLEMCGLLMLLFGLTPNASFAQTTSVDSKRAVSAAAIPSGPIGPAIDNAGLLESMRQVERTSRAAAPKAHAKSEPASMANMSGPQVPVAGGPWLPAGLSNVNVPKVAYAMEDPATVSLSKDAIANVPGVCAGETDAENYQYCQRMQHVLELRVDCAGMGSPQGQAHCEKQVAELTACRASRTAAELNACQQSQRTKR